MYKISHTHQQIANGSGVRSRLFGSLVATALAFCLLGFAHTASAVTVKVDSTQTWQGFNNVTGTNGFATYHFGSDWALEDLRAEFIKTSPPGFPLNDIGIQRVNTNTYNPADPFWNDTNGVANAFIEANWYVDVFTNFSGETVTFEGTVISNSIPLAPLAGLPSADPAAWHVVAWIKEFTPTYGFVGITTSTNLAAGPFSVTRPIGPGFVCQYGFYTYGPNTAPGSADALAGLRVGVEDSDPGWVTQPAGATIIAPDPIDLTAVAVGATALSYQWQKDGTNVVDAGVISGATTTNLVVSSTVAGDSGDYTCIVTDTAGSATSDVATVVIVPVLITLQPEDQRVQVGSDVVFTAAATSQVPLIYRWFRVNPATGLTNQVIGINYNPPSLDSGEATDTLSLTNVQVSDTGEYILRIFDGSNFVWTDKAQLLVRTPADYVNFVENWGYENSKTNDSPWVRFETEGQGPDGALQDTNDTYFLGGNVDVYEGDYVSFTTYHATWSGIYQDVAVEPGQFFVASMNFFNASGDPIPSGAGITNRAYLEVQFRDAADNVLQQYTSDLDAMSTTNLPPEDVWFELVATNAGDFGGGSGTDGLYLEAPAGSATARFQVSMEDQGGSVPGGTVLGSLYYDAASLLLKIPAEITVVDQVGGTTDVSWPSHAAMSYKVQFKDNLDDPSWTTLEIVAGDGTVITKSYASAGANRFYRVLTL